MRGDSRLLAPSSCVRRGAGLAAVSALSALLGACSSPQGTRMEMEVGSTKLVLSRGVATVDGGTLLWESAGEGTPVVLLHGGQMDRRMWDDQFPALSKDHWVIRYDLRGYGDSSPPAGPYEHHEDLLVVLDQLNLEKAHLVGLSLGGSVAIDFALEHPERVASLALVSPGMSGWTWGREDWIKPLSKAVADRDEDAIVETWLGSDYMQPAMEQKALAPRLRELTRANIGAWLAEDTEVPLDPPAVARLRELQGPMILMLGARDTEDIHHIVERLAVIVPGARVVTFDGAGHLPNMEQPQAFNRELLGWLADVAR